MTFIRVHRGAQWILGGDCRLPVSIESDTYDGQNLRCILRWVKEHFRHCSVIVADTLQRHNLPAFLSEEEKIEISRNAGEAWLKRNRKTIDAAGFHDRVTRWDDWRLDKNFAPYFKKLNKLYQQSRDFQSAITRDVERFLTRKYAIKGTDPGIRDRCSRYLIEEIAFQALAERQKPAVEVYAGSQLAGSKIFRKSKLGDSFPELGGLRFLEIRLAVEVGGGELE